MKMLEAVAKNPLRKEGSSCRFLNSGEAVAESKPGREVYLSVERSSVDT